MGQKKLTTSIHRLADLAKNFIILLVIYEFGTVATSFGFETLGLLLKLPLLLTAIATIGYYAFRTGAIYLLPTYTKSLYRNTRSGMQSLQTSLSALTRPPADPDPGSEPDSPTNPTVPTAAAKRTNLSEDTQSEDTTPTRDPAQKPIDAEIWD